MVRLRGVSEVRWRFLASIRTRRKDGVESAVGPTWKQDGTFSRNEENRAPKSRKQVHWLMPAVHSVQTSRRDAQGAGVWDRGQSRMQSSE